MGLTRIDSWYDINGSKLRNPVFLFDNFIESDNEPSNLGINIIKRYQLQHCSYLATSADRDFL